MRTFIKIVSIALLTTSSWNAFAQPTNQSQLNTGLKQVIIYRYDPGRKKDHKVKAIALLGDKCYYFKKVPKIQIGKPISPDNGKYISDANLNTFISSLTFKNFENVNRQNCNCKAISEDTFVVEISPDGKPGNRKIFYVPVLNECPKDSPCTVIGTIYGFFIKLKRK
jgi:hypothetical protein